MTDFIWAYQTLASKSQAVKMTKVLVKEKLIACANILDNVTSIYEWKGDVCDEEELSVIMKTTKEKVKSLEKKIVELHPYECPAILIIPIAGGHENFLNWIKEQVRT